MRALAVALVALGCSSGPADLAPCSVRCGAGGMCPDEALCFPDGFCHRAGDPPACEVDAFGAADAPLQPDAGIDAEPPDAAPPDTSPPDGASCGELGCQQSLGETCASCPLDCGFCVEDGPSIPDGPPLG